MGEEFSKKKIGRIEDTWKIKETIGRGQNARVRRCFRKSDRLEAAVKIIRKRDIVKSKIPNFIPLAKILMSEEGSHPNCVEIYAIFNTKHHVYIVQEICKGGELFDAIVEQNFSVEEACKVLKQITGALIHIHRLGIIHHDLKPENVLMTEDKVVKIVDIGIDPLFDDGERLLGKYSPPPWYSSPEKLTLKSVNEATDYWSLGIIFYVLLCGYLPFYDENIHVAKTLVRIAKLEFHEGEGECWDHISDEVKDFIRKMLTRDVGARITGREILAHPLVSNVRGLDYIDCDVQESWMRTFFEPSAIHENAYSGWISNYTNFLVEMKGLEPFYLRSIRASARRRRKYFRLGENKANQKLEIESKNIDCKTQETE